MNKDRSRGDRSMEVTLVHTNTLSEGKLDRGAPEQWQKTPMPHQSTFIDLSNLIRSDNSETVTPRLQKMSAMRSSA